MSRQAAPVSAEEYRRRLVDLCGRGRVQLFPPRRRRDRAILLHAVARGLRTTGLSERQVNARITEWLTWIGKDLEADVASVRRALVDEGFLDRDASGSSYGPSRRHERWAAFAPDVEGIDVESVLAQAEREAEEKRRQHAS